MVGPPGSHTPWDVGHSPVPDDALDTQLAVVLDKVARQFVPEDQPRLARRVAGGIPSPTFAVGRQSPTTAGRTTVVDAEAPDARILRLNCGGKCDGSGLGST